MENLEEEYNRALEDLRDYDTEKLKNYEAVSLFVLKARNLIDSFGILK